MVGRRPRAAAQRTAADRAVWAEVADGQAAVVARRQLLALGLSDGQIGARIDGGHWVGVHPGVYTTVTGPLPALARAWAAVLYGGDSAALGGTAALWLHRVLDEPPPVMTVCVPEHRRVRRQPGLVVQVRRGLGTMTHPAAQPPRLRLAPALLDATHAMTTPGPVVDLVLRVTRGRHETPGRLAEELTRRHAHRWRSLLGELLEEAGDGVASGLERRWVRAVERPHRLPRAERNAPDVGPAGRRVYRDLWYRRWRLVIELDGRAAHPPWLAFRDRQRDNAVALRGEVALRYGWREVAADPCGVAGEVARALRAGGWPGTVRRCGPTCTA